jgi:hypothetical protein
MVELCRIVHSVCGKDSMLLEHNWIWLKDRGFFIDLLEMNTSIYGGGLDYPVRPGLERKIYSILIDLFRSGPRGKRSQDYIHQNLWGLWGLNPFRRCFRNLKHSRIPFGISTSSVCLLPSYVKVPDIVMIKLFFAGSTALVGPGLFFSFMIILQTVGLFGWVISSSQGLYLNTGQHKHRINTYTH